MTGTAMIIYHYDAFPLNFSWALDHQHPRTKPFVPHHTIRYMYRVGGKTHTHMSHPTQEGSMHPCCCWLPLTPAAPAASPVVTSAAAAALAGGPASAGDVGSVPRHTIPLSASCFSGHKCLLLLLLWLHTACLQQDIAVASSSAALSLSYLTSFTTGLTSIVPPLEKHQLLVRRSTWRSCEGTGGG